MSWKKKADPENHWMSLSDMMTGLMVIFMFVAISYMVKSQEAQAQRDRIFEEFKTTEEDLYAELKQEFKDDFKRWQVQLDKDLSIKFTNPQVLFESAKERITPRFRQILNSFLPRYFNVLLQDKYRDKISEIRIEGHTDPRPLTDSESPFYDEDSYIGNLMLSQARATEVVWYFRRMRYYRRLDRSKKGKLRFWLTANGLSSGRTLDRNKKLTYESGKRVHNATSRRVEFRIMTNSRELVEKAIEQISN